MPPESWAHTCVPQAVPGQSVSTLQGVVCACARPAAVTATSPNRKDKRSFVTRALMSGSSVISRGSLSLQTTGRERVEAELVREALDLAGEETGAHQHRPQVFDVV